MFQVESLEPHSRGDENLVRRGGEPRTFASSPPRLARLWGSDKTGRGAV